VSDTILIIGLLVVAVVIFAVIAARRNKATPQLGADEDLKLPKAAPTPPKRPKREKKPAAAKPREEKPGPAAPTPAEAPEEDDDEVPVSEGEEEAPSGPPPSDEAPAGPPPAPIARRKADVAGLRRGLSKVRQAGGFFGRLKELFAGKKEIDPGIVEELEEILLTSDVGVKTTEALLEAIREGLERNELDNTDMVWDALREKASDLMEISGGGPLRNYGSPTVVLLVGVNGTGKTTTIGKLATRFVTEERQVLLVAADTFRAAAVAQLKAWGKRVGCEVFAGKDGADPASVVFDAIEHGLESGADIILVDTAGRLHTKANLMDELKKVARTAGKALKGAPHETLLVVDGTTGQNAVQQAEMFSEAMDLSGIVLCKLDGTAKGGVVLAIAAEHEIPVRYIGVGERPQDLRDFDAEEFVEAMLGQGDEAVEAA
jgi:fused signal recognition particle receptor